VERLVEALWGDDPPHRAVEMLHVRISELRRFLHAEPDIIVTRRPGYVLDVASERVDAQRFEIAVPEARRALDDGDAAVAVTGLDAALAMWRGPALPEIADRSFAQPYVARLENLHTQAVEDRIAARLALGQHRDVVAELEALVREHPLHERHRHLLMLALYRDGQQSEALEVYQQGVELLREELGIDPSQDLQDLWLKILRHDAGLSAPQVIAVSRRQAHELPVELTSFVGRDAELQDTCTRLAASRLVTLSGVGGAGKSRLAIEVAQERREAFPDGIWIVELALVGDPALVSSTVAAVVGAHERPQDSLRDAIVERLRSAVSLLVLDNCEHLVEEVADLTRDLLRRCPGLRVLCTSREKLGLAGEVVIEVSGLTVPQPADAAAELVLASGAARLFVERAEAAQSRFRLTDNNAPAVAEIARRLDGLPLSIELAAAHTAAFAPAQIAAGLQDQFRLLSGGSRAALPRHRTLRAVVDWSYDLLTEDEQRLFDRLTVFVGGFGIDAVVAVGGTDAPDLLARLVDKSLVTADVVEPEYRYRMLETLRAYGLEELNRQGVTAEVRDAHARYYFDLATAAAVGLRSKDLASWLDRLNLEHANLRAALDWSLASDANETAAGIAAALYPFWDLRGFYSEGREWLRRVLMAGRRLSPPLRARVLMGATTLAVIQGDITAATAAGEEAASLSRATGDLAGLSHALQYLGFMAVLLEDHNQARALLAEAERAGAESGSRWEHAWSYIFLATHSFSEDGFVDADAHADRAEELIGPDGDQELLAWVSLIRGMAAWGLGSTADAARQFIKGAAQFRELGGLWGLTFALLGAGLVLTDANEGRNAVRAFSTAQKLRETAGTGVHPFVEVATEAALGRLRSELDADTFDAEWAAGKRYSLTEALRTTESALTGVLRAASTAKRDDPTDGTSGQ
jgi:predicted ATPase/DNA-binding SARP family transcriptional activator